MKTLRFSSMFRRSGAKKLPKKIWGQKVAEDIASILEACDQNGTDYGVSLDKLPAWCAKAWQIETDKSFAEIIENSGYFGGLQVTKNHDSIVIVSEVGTQEEMDFLADVVALAMREHNIEGSATYIYGQDDAGIAIIGPNGGGFVSLSSLENEESSGGAGIALVMEQFADAVGWEKTMELIVKAAAYHGQTDTLKAAIDVNETSHIKPSNS